MPEAVIPSERYLKDRPETGRKRVLACLVLALIGTSLLPLFSPPALACDPNNPRGSCYQGYTAEVATYPPGKREFVLTGSIPRENIDIGWGVTARILPPEAGYAQLAGGGGTLRVVSVQGDGWEGNGVCVLTSQYAREKFGAEDKCRITVLKTPSR